MTPAAWRQALDTFFHRCTRAGAAVVYRVELQRRKAPHLHGVLYCPRGKGKRQGPGWFKEDWLECCDEDDDMASWLHSGVFKEQVDEGWSLYVSMHHGKHKADQLGWVGKQWGIVNRKLFVRRESKSYQVTPQQRARLARALRRYTKPPKRKSRVFTVNGRVLRCVPERVTSRLVEWALLP